MARFGRSAMLGAAESPDTYTPPTDRKSGPFRDHEVQNGLETLVKAHQIKQNAAYHSAIQQHAKTMMAATNQNGQTPANGD